MITMGPPKAVEILKHALYMGADRVWLISDRRFAAADTLATSYVLAEAVKKLGNVQLVLAGRQAIDGDTAQVGPQVAEKIDFNQVTYVTEVKEIAQDHVVVERDGETRSETIRTGFPVLLTVTASANTPRFPNAARMLKFFRSGLESDFDGEGLESAKTNDWVIPSWTLDDMGLDPERCGLNGSPTKVHKIKSITLKGTDLQLFNKEKTGIQEMVRNIVKDYAEVER